MVRPIAGKTFVVSRGFRLFRELFKFQDVEKLRDDRIYLAAVTGEIQGDAYTGQIGNVVVDFLECLYGSSRLELRRCTFVRSLAGFLAREVTIARIPAFCRASWSFSAASRPAAS